MPEFPRAALEALREPLETGHITIARAAQRAEFPARFQMIAAMNPCPCGFLGSTQRACRCTPDQVHRYQAKLSGPLLDRIDLHVEVPALPAEQLVQAAAGESTASIRARVEQARALALARQGSTNQALQGQAIDAQLRTVRAGGIRGLLGQDDQGATVHQARIAAHALESWAEVRGKTEEMKQWAAERLGLPKDTAFDTVAEKAMERLAEERTHHSTVVSEWGQLHPAPSPLSIQRRLAGLDAELQSAAHKQIPALATVLPAGESSPLSPARAPERTLNRPGIDR